jgi:hypothetical protein
MRIAESVSHRIFERTLRPSAFRGARLFERHHTLQALLDVGRRPGRSLLRARRRTRLEHLGAVASDRERSKTSSSFARRPLARLAFRALLLSGGRRPVFTSLASNQAGIPAELKHINKRRKRNQPGLP